MPIVTDADASAQTCATDDELVSGSITVPATAGLHVVTAESTNPAYQVSQGLFNLEVEGAFCPPVLAITRCS